MRLLVIDTATGRNGAMVLSDNGATASFSPSHRPRSNEIFPLAKTVMAQADVAPADLDAIVITSGPGSFTGLRVGYGFAAGMADALGIPLLGVPTLTAMAVGARLEGFGGTLVPLLVARKGELYAALFACDGGVPRRLGPDFSPTPDELAARLSGPVAFVGDGFDSDGPLAEKGRLIEGFGETAERSPLMGAATLAVAALVDGDEESYPADLVYVRRSQAEINWDRLHPQPQTGGMV